MSGYRAKDWPCHTIFATVVSYTLSSLVLPLPPPRRGWYLIKGRLSMCGCGHSMHNYVAADIIASIIITNMKLRYWITKEMLIVQLQRPFISCHWQPYSGSFHPLRESLKCRETSISATLHKPDMHLTIITQNQSHIDYSTYFKRFMEWDLYGCLLSHASFSPLRGSLNTLHKTDCILLGANYLTMCANYTLAVA